jgi:hypothetical protein
MSHILGVNNDVVVEECVSNACEELFVKKNECAETLQYFDTIPVINHNIQGLGERIREPVLDVLKKSKTVYESNAVLDHYNTLKTEVTPSQLSVAATPSALHAHPVNNDAKTLILGELAVKILQDALSEYRTQFGNDQSHLNTILKQFGFDQQSADDSAHKSEISKKRDLNTSQLSNKHNIIHPTDIIPSVNWQKYENPWSGGIHYINNTCVDIMPLSNKYNKKMTRIDFEQFEQFDTESIKFPNVKRMEFIMYGTNPHYGKYWVYTDAYDIMYVCQPIKDGYYYSIRGAELEIPI